MVVESSGFSNSTTMDLPLTVSNGLLSPGGETKNVFWSLICTNSLNWMVTLCPLKLVEYCVGVVLNTTGASESRGPPLGGLIVAHRIVRMATVAAIRASRMINFSMAEVF